MQRIIDIVESPLAFHSMRVFDLQVDPSANKMEDIRLNERTAHVTAEQARKAFEYFSMDRADRSPAEYQTGCLKIVHTVKDLYDSLITDNTWSDSSKSLFEAVNCGNIVKVKRMEGKSRQSDLNRKGKQVSVHSSHLVVVHVKANAKLYWDRERELHAFAQENAEGVKFTSADPGPFSEYERRFAEAAENDNLGNTDVLVRYLDVAKGEAVEETVRVYQKFVLEEGVQLSLVQALYEICVWHYSIQAKLLEEWRKCKDKNLYAEKWAERMNKKIRIVRLLSKLQVLPSRESTSKKMDAKMITEVAEKPKKPPKKPSKFERFYAEMKKHGTTKTRVQLKEVFDEMPQEEKEKYGNPDTRKPPSASPPKKKTVAEPLRASPPSPPSSPSAPLGRLSNPENKSLDDDSEEEQFFSEEEEDDDYDVNDPDDGEKCLAEYAFDEEQEDGKGERAKVAKPSGSRSPKRSENVKQTTVLEGEKNAKKRKPEESDARAASGKKPKKASVEKKVSAEDKTTAKKKTHKPEKTQKIIGKEIVHDLVESERTHFLWELLSQNMQAMVNAKRSFTPFGKTPFEEAYVAFAELKGKDDEERFNAAKKILSKTPGVNLCFQMFNLLFGKEEEKPDDVDDLIFG